VHVDALADGLAAVDLGEVVVLRPEVRVAEDRSGEFAEALRNHEQVIARVAQYGRAVLREVERGERPVDCRVGDRDHAVTFFAPVVGQ
jgi:hypothetical protein